MKPKAFSTQITVMAALLLAFPFTAINAQDEKAADSRSITVVTSPSLSGLAASLASGYSKASGVAARVRTAESPGEICNPPAGELSITADGLQGFTLNANALPTVIGRNVTVGIVNSANPVMADLVKKGLTAGAIAGLFSNDGTTSWGSITGSADKSPVRMYAGNNPGADAALQAFAGSAPAGGLNTAAGDIEAIAAVQGDRNGLAFVSLSSLAYGNANVLPAGTAILPIDRNGNGLIDFPESIYSDLNAFARGVWIGKYPKALVSNLYAVLPSDGNREDLAAFARWIVTDGQDMISAGGHTELIAAERVSAADRIAQAVARPVAIASSAGVSVPLLIILSLICATGALAFYASSYLRKRKYAEKVHIEASSSSLQPSVISVPAGIYFDKAHTWAFMDQEGTVTAGVDDFLQHVTGPITGVKMLEAGRRIKRGDRFLSLIQNGKQLDLYAPVSGTIEEVNTSLENDSSAINTSPYKNGWVYKISPSNWLRENPLMFMAERQFQHLNREMGRLRDFLAKAHGSDTGTQLVLQDGGEIRDGVLSSLGPEVWEDFQSDFIDPSKQVWFHEIQ